MCFRVLLNVKEMNSIVEKTIGECESILNKISLTIWKNPELCFEERTAHDLLTSALEEWGFKVQKHYLLDTAFRAEFGSENSPTIGVICEYDALPNIGHACGHNLIAEVGLAAGLAIKSYLETDTSICGKVVVLGTPAEEGGGGKIKMIEGGAFKNIDAALMAHPQAVNRLYPLVLDLARVTVKYRMKDGFDPWCFSNAVDAAVSCYNNVTILRSSLSSKWRISGIMHCKNWKETELEFSYRAPTKKELTAIKRKLETCMRSAAETTDCICEIDFHQESEKEEYRGLVTNTTIVKVFEKHAEQRGFVFRDDDISICESAVSTDMGNVSHIVPSIQPEYSIEAAPHVNHTSGFAIAAASPIAHTISLRIAESLALTAIELMTTPELLQKVKVEFETNPHIDSSSPFRSLGE